MCSRFEGAAPTGGISTTSAIAERISENDDIFIQELAFVKLKNIPKPQSLHILHLDGDSSYNVLDIVALVNMIFNPDLRHMGNINVPYIMR